MLTDYWHVEIEYQDGPSTRVRDVSRQMIADGVLTLYRRSGPLDEQHLGSWPLTSIKKWTRLPR